jgi:3-oxoacyl-[acyl-carrier protein] reductase
MAEPRAYDIARRFDLTGRRVAITGAAHGLGLAMATAFGSAGAHVALLDRDQDGLVALEDELQAHAKVCAFPIDVRDDVQVSRVVAQLTAEMGGLDILINGSAIYPTGPVAEMPDDVFLDVLNVNIAGYARMCRAAQSHLADSPAGRIINFSSITFLMGYPPGLAAYVASKGAVIGLTRALAREVGPLGVTVNAIAPGAFPTRAEDIVEDRVAYSDEVIGKQCIKRRGEVSDIAAAAMFLASDAASFITGQTLVVDGGWMFH